MLQKLAKVLTRKPAFILTLAVLMLFPSLYGAIHTRVNYDILSYLPSDLDSTRGQAILEDTFHNAATAMLVVEGMPAKDVEVLRDKIEDVPNVSNALWISNLIDISIPKEILPDELKNIFYSKTAPNSTMIIVQFEHPGASNETLKAIEDVRGLCNEQCFLSGVSVFLKDTKDLVEQEMPLYTLLAVAFSILAMSLTMESWLLPLVYIMGIGFAVAYNFGTNVFLGQVSYITKAIAAILQLGVTMDYSIFLVDRYDEEKPKFADRRDAMASAIESAFVSLSGSSLTTIAGFATLCAMRLGLGGDIGIVMAKGVIIGIMVVLIVLPSLVLQFDKPIHRWTHRSFIPDFANLNNWIIDHRKAFVILFVVLFLPAFYLQSKTEIYYNIDQSLPADLASTIATDKMKEQFNMATTHFILVDDALPAYQLSNMVKDIENVDGIEAVLAYNKVIGPGVPNSFIPQEVKDLCKKDGMQMIMVNSRYKAARAEENAQIDTLTGIVKQYDPEALITGEGAMTKDLSDITTTDIKVTNILSIVAILIIVALLFKSITIPIVLVSAIELSIFINEGIPALTGTVLPFISPIVIGCIQLGATVDYAILMTTRFQEELRAGHERVEAIKIASNSADRSIITSALVFFCANSGVSLISKIEIIQSLCSMLARGAIISALVSIFILPSVLLVCEPIFKKTSINWTGKKTNKNALEE
ncbi:MAG: MMPL family transporter [Oscillospiraceae bacterium]